MTLPETKFQGGEGRSELKRNWKVGHRDCCLEKFEWERKKLDWIWELKDTVFFLAWEKRECVINRGENAREEVKWREAMCRETCLWAEGRAWRTSKEDGIHDPRACTVEGQHGQSRDLLEVTLLDPSKVTHQDRREQTKEWAPDLWRRFGVVAEEGKRGNRRSKVALILFGI